MITEPAFRLPPIRIVPAAAAPINGIRMVFRNVREAQYQSIPGLHVLTIRI